MTNITIIVPIYNEAVNLSHCIFNLLEQDSQNFHTIFIDDGSTDDSISVLKSLLNEVSPQFTYEILKQNNQGAARAREIGIRKATTKYVMSLDADDSYSNDMISKLESVIPLDPDIILPNMESENENGQLTPFIFFKEDTKLTGKECLENSLGKWGVHGCICTKRAIFLKSYGLYNSYNQKNFLNNDEVITRLNYFHAQYVHRIDATYYYLYNSNSTTKSLNLNRYGRCNNAIIMHKIFSNHSNLLEERTQIELFNTIRHTRRYFKNNKEHITNKRVWKKTIKKAIRYSLSRRPLKISLKKIINLMKYYVTL